MTLIEPIKSTDRIDQISTKLYQTSDELIEPITETKQPQIKSTDRTDQIDTTLYQMNRSNQSPKQKQCETPTNWFLSQQQRHPQQHKSFTIAFVSDPGQSLYNYFIYHI